MSMLRRWGPPLVVLVVLLATAPLGPHVADAMYRVTPPSLEATSRPDEGALDVMARGASIT